MEDLEGEGLFHDQIEGVGEHRQSNIYRLHLEQMQRIVD